MSKFGQFFLAFEHFLGKAKSVLWWEFCHYAYLHLMVVSYISIFSTVSLFRYYSFSSSAWDLGIFNQAFYTTVKYGRLFYYTCELYGTTGTYFGSHFSPILFLLVPFYIVLPRPETLLVAQTIILASGAYPTFLLSNHVFKNKSLSLLFSLIYLAYPQLHSVNWFDFHPEAFFVPFALFSLYYFVREKWFKYFLFLGLSFFTKEFASVPIFVFASVELWFKRNAVVSSIEARRLQDKKILVLLITIVASILWYIIAKAFLYFFNPSPNPGYIRGYPWLILGGNPLELSILGSITHLDFLNALKFQWETKLFYLFTFLGPLAFLPLLKPSMLLATLPWFLLAFLSNNYPYYTLGFHYPAFLIPFAVTATIYGVDKLRSTFNFDRGALLKLVKKLTLVCLVISLVLTLTKAPPYNIYTLTISNHDRNIYRALKLIPPEASVLTQHDIFPQISSNLNSFVIPPHSGAFEKTYYDSYVKSLFDKELEYIVIDINPDVETPGEGHEVTWSMMFNGLANSENYGLYASIDGVLIYKFMYSEKPVYYEPFTLLQKYNTLVNCNTTIFSHFLPTGRYNATLRIYTNIEVVGQLLTVEVLQNSKVLESKNIFNTGVNNTEGQDFSFPLTIVDQTTEVEFRIINPSSFTTIRLGSLKIVQISYSESDL